MTETLTCDISALGYPKAALFSFCMALDGYNVVVVIQAALRAVHGEQTVLQHISGATVTGDFPDL